MNISETYFCIVRVRRRLKGDPSTTRIYSNEIVTAIAFPPGSFATLYRHIYSPGSHIHRICYQPDFCPPFRKPPMFIIYFTKDPNAFLIIGGIKKKKRFRKLPFNYFPKHIIDGWAYAIIDVFIDKGIKNEKKIKMESRTL